MHGLKDLFQRRHTSIVSPPGDLRRQVRAQARILVGHAGLTVLAAGRKGIPSVPSTPVGAGRSSAGARRPLRDIRAPT